MTIKSRLNRAERAAALLGRKQHPPRVFVYYEGHEPADLVTAGPQDTIIKVTYEDKKPISTITGAGGYKKYIGIDMVEF